VVRKATVHTNTPMRFHPSQDFFYRAPVLISVSAAVPRTRPPYEGRGYFLEIFPPEDVEPGRDYPITISVESGRGPSLPWGLQRQSSRNRRRIGELVNIALGTARSDDCVGWRQKFRQPDHRRRVGGCGERRTGRLRPGRIVAFDGGLPRPRRA